MKPGRIARIRVNSKDCMAVCDVLDKLEIKVAGMSFSQAVSLTLSSAMESFRQNKVIPIRDGFEFDQLMQRFPPDRLADRARKLDITAAIGLHGAQALVPETPEVKRRRLRYDELLFKRENDPLNFTDAEQEEFRPLVEEFYPV